MIMTSNTVLREFVNFSSLGTQYLTSNMSVLSISIVLHGLAQIERRISPNFNITTV